MMLHTMFVIRLTNPYISYNITITFQLIQNSVTLPVSEHMLTSQQNVSVVH